MTALDSFTSPHSAPIYRIPDNLHAPFREILGATIGIWAASFGQRLISAVLFGSVARGTPRKDSDIDLLVVAQELPRSLAERRRPLLEQWQKVRSANALPYVEWNLVVKSPEEARSHSPLYLDIVEDGIILLDQGRFFEHILEGMRKRMRALGSRRVFLQDGSWYWDLKPDFRFGEVVEI